MVGCMMVCVQADGGAGWAGGACKLLMGGRLGC